MMASIAIVAGLSACLPIATSPPSSPTEQGPHPQTPSPTADLGPATPLASNEPSPAPTGWAPTSTPDPTATEPEATATLLSERAPRLPRSDVHFITHGDRGSPLVALTFDVGQMPSNPAGFDDGIYHALVEKSAPATFFLGGDWMRTHLAETRLLDSNPLFELGNHSWSHPDMRELDEPEIALELLRTQDMMYQATGHQTRLFRLPSGLYSDLVLSVAAWHGLYVIQWDVVTGDPVPDNSAENIVKLVRQRVDNGSIIVMHANGRGWHTAEALPAMVDHLRAEGYCLVTVSQMIGLRPVPPNCPTTDFELP